MASLKMDEKWQIIGRNFSFLVGCDFSSIGPRNLNLDFLGTIKIGLLTLLFLFSFESSGWMLCNALSFPRVPLLPYAFSLVGLLLLFSGTLSLVGPPLFFYGSIVVVVELLLFYCNSSTPLLGLPLLIFCGTLSFDGVPMFVSITIPLLEVCDYFWWLSLNWGAFVCQW